jgi:hypothetical protein
LKYRFSFQSTKHLRQFFLYEFFTTKVSSGLQLEEHICLLVHLEEHIFLLVHPQELLITDGKSSAGWPGTEQGG